MLTNSSLKCHFLLINSVEDPNHNSTKYLYLNKTKLFCLKQAKEVKEKLNIHTKHMLALPMIQGNVKVLFRMKEL